MNLFLQGHGKSLPPNFHWINEPTAWQFGTSGELTVVAPPLADFFEDPAGANVRSSAPYLYTSVERDFTIATRVDVDMIDDCDSACLMVMVDNHHWAKLCFENAYRQPTIVSVVTVGSSDDCNGQTLNVNKPYLRVTRFGDCYAFHYSIDGAYWSLARYFKMPSPRSVKVGVVGQSPFGNGCRSTFSFLDYVPDPVRNLRSGE